MTALHYIAAAMVGLGQRKWQLEGADFCPYSAHRPCGRSQRSRSNFPAGRPGFLRPPLDNPIVAEGYPVFLDELKKSGFIEGQNLTVEYVRLDQDTQQLFAQTSELARSKVDLLVTTGSEDGLRAALAASPTTPIVMWAINFDPIAKGYVKGLARPGGNVTGIVSLQTELAAKQVELLTDVFPDRTRLAVLAC